MRSSAAVILPVAALALTLSACGSNSATPSASPTAAPTSVAASPTVVATPTETPTPTPTAHPSVAPQSSIDGITVTDVAATPAPGATAAPTPGTTVPQVSFQAPFAVDQTRSKVLKQGSGATIAATSTVTLNYVGVNGYDGKTFDSSFTRGKAATFPLDKVIPGFANGLNGKHVGDRVLIAIPGKDGYDAAGGSPDAGILVGDTLIFVVDIVGTDYQTPFGTAVQPAAGLPVVGQDDKGRPTLKIDTSATPPAQQVTQPLVAGTDPHKVALTDAVAVHYRTWSWKSGQMIEDGYDTAQTATVNQLIDCWKTGLVGQTPGSRVMLVCPSSTAFPNGNATPSIAPGETLVYIVDVVTAADPSQQQG